MQMQELIKAAEDFQGDIEVKKNEALLQEVGAGVVAWLLLTLRDARKFRGRVTKLNIDGTYENEGTHFICEVTGTGECWICGKETCC